MAQPSKATVRAFNVGFGDCFLLSFTYPDGDRHVLIDFGAKPKPRGSSDDYMTEIAAEIKKLTGDKLAMLVATHRHTDHISGFATKDDGSGSGDIIASLAPDVVLQPWTEHPDIETDATAPRGDRAFAIALKGMNAFAASLQDFALRKPDDAWRRLGFSEKEVRHLKFTGENNVKNLNAVKNLMAMGAKGKALYLSADEEPDVSDVLPGVTLHVLGPPTVDQHPNVQKQKASIAEEYWQLMGRRGFAAALATGQDGDGEGGGEVLFSDYIDDLPPYARWAKNRLSKAHKEMLLSMVTALDDAMNNTSLILLFRAGGKSLLFPGDAQWENWQYALEFSDKKDEYKRLLRDIDLYKVGHHGSRNATPRSLWALFQHKDEDKARKDRLVTMMSTMHDVHGGSEATAVPRATLVKELDDHSHLHTTEDLKNGQLFTEVVLDL